MMIAQRFYKVRKRYKAVVQNRGVEETMFTRYVRHLTKQNCPVVLSITDAETETKSVASIHRNNIREDNTVETTDILIRAREIYFRARRQRPVRAASIF